MDNNYVRFRLKDGFEVSTITLNSYIGQKKNQSFKLLPLKEEGGEWEKLLETLIVELSGLLVNTSYKNAILLTILNKLQGLKTNKEVDFSIYRKTIFEIISLLEEIGETDNENIRY